MNLSNKKITIPLISKWTVIITLIFVLMRITHIVDWSPLWLLCPLWIPAAIALSFYLIPTFLIILLTILGPIIDFLEKTYKKLKKK